jgi:Na+-driven multidrug efflux pump
MHRVSDPSFDRAVTTPAARRGIASVWSDVRLAARGTRHDYTSGSIGRAIFLLAVPMVLEMIMESLFAVSDVFFVGRLGPDAVATVGLTESLMIVIYTIAAGLSISTIAVVSRRIGEKDPDAAARAAVQAIAIAFLISVSLAGAGSFFAPQLLHLMGASPAVLASGSMFTRVMLGGSTTVFLLLAWVREACSSRCSPPILCSRR